MKMSEIGRTTSRMTALASLRRRIQKLTPYFSLLILAVPVLIIEPVKFVAVFVAGKGHWLTATGMIIAAYVASLVVVERLFRAVKPKLLMLGWFAKLWARYTTLRDKVFAIFARRSFSTEPKLTAAVETEPPSID